MDDVPVPAYPVGAGWRLEVGMSAQEEITQNPRQIPLRFIDPSPDNRHCTDDDQGILELSANIRDNGLINPITVRPRGADRFEIVCGERRWRAHRVGGLAEIACFVQDLDDTQAQILRISENLMRKDLTFMEEGEGVAALLRVTGDDYSEVSNRLDRTESWLRRRAKLPNLVQEWRDAVAEPAGPYQRIRDSVDKLEELARLPQDTQRDLLASGVLAGVYTTPELRQKIMRHLRQIGSQPWTRDWEKSKTSSSRRCAKCLKRSNIEATLFDDLHDELPELSAGKKAMCLDGSCWQTKLQAWCKYLLDENPKAVPIWDGVPTTAERQKARDFLERDILSVNDWYEHLPKTPIAEGETLGKGVFVGGVHIGQLVDIVIADPDKAKKLDAESAARMKKQEQEEHDRELQAQKLRAQIDQAIPGCLADMVADFGLTHAAVMPVILNLAAAFGTTADRAKVDYSNNMLFSAGELVGSPPACTDSLWAGIRSDIVSLLADADPDWLDDDEKKLFNALRAVFRLESALPEMEA